MFLSHQKFSKCTYFCVENKVFSLFLSLVVLFNIDGVFHPGFSINVLSMMYLQSLIISCYHNLSLNIHHCV